MNNETNENRNSELWTCASCGASNTRNFCTNCGAPKPAEPEVLETEAVNEPEPETAETKETERVKPEPVKTAAPVKEIHYRRPNPLVTALIAGIVGLGAGYGGSALALRNYKADPQVIVQETTPITQPAVTDDTSANLTATNTSGALTIQEVAATASKTVVEIQTENQTTTYGLFGGTYTSKSAGSGVIISPDGYIITNNHVVNGSTKIVIKTYDGFEYEAELIGTDSKSDIAVIKIDATGLSAAEIGDSDSLQVGDTAVVIGNPLGTLGGTVTSGIISATNRDMVINSQSMTLIQTTAAINNGNSGGGLFDTYGRLVGIVNAKDSGLTSSGSVIEGLGFAIPINTAYSVATDLMENGYVTSRPTIGVGLSTLSENYGQYNAGLYISQVYEGGGAEAAGLRAYDRIVSADGTEINSYTDLSKVLNNKKVGDTLTLEIEREGTIETYEVTLTEPLESMRQN